MAAPVATPTEPWPAPRKARAKTCPNFFPQFLLYSNLNVNFVGQILGGNFGGPTRGRFWGNFGAQMRAPRTIPNKTPHMRASRGPAARLTRRRAKSRFGTPRKDRNNSRLHPRSGSHAAICQPNSALVQPQSHSELLHVMSHSRIMVLAC